MENTVGVLVALGGGAGIALVIREVVGVIGLLRRGVSANEGKRKADLVQQRDEAYEMRDQANAYAEAATRDRGRLSEYAAALRVDLVDKGTYRRDQLPAWPELESTTPARQVRKIAARVKNDQYVDRTFNE